MKPFNTNGNSLMMVNIGCGKRYHKEWINIDLNPKSPDVIGYDLTAGLPFESNSIDVCYSSHVLEHLKSKDADLFIQEQRRVLKENGILRIVVPDLEMICKNYCNYSAHSAMTTLIMPDLFS